MGKPFTIITAFFDIGRGDWSHHYKRSTDEYLASIRNVCHLDIDMVFFTEEQFAQIISEFRKNNPARTTIVIEKFEDIQSYKYLPELTWICQQPKDHPMPECPEISNPKYSILMTSKIDFMLQGSQYAHTDYIIWLDAGYTHNKRDLSNLDWNPMSLLNHLDKISVICLRNLDDASSDPKTFSSQYIDVVTGGFIGMTKNTLISFYPLYYQFVEDIIYNHHIMEDDQFFMVLLIKKYPELFNVIPGGWFSALDFQ